MTKQRTYSPFDSDRHATTSTHTLLAGPGVCLYDLLLSLKLISAGRVHSRASAAVTSLLFSARSDLNNGDNRSYRIARAVRDRNIHNVQHYMVILNNNKKKIYIGYGVHLLH